MDGQETKNSLIQRLLKSSSIYALSGIIRNSIGFIMLPIYTQYLSPEDYGIVALMVFTISLIEITLGARMGHAPQKFFHDYKEEKDRLRVIATALFTTVIVSIIITTLAIFNSDSIAVALFSDKSLQPVVALFLLLISTQAVEFIGLIFIRIQNRYKLFFALSMFKLIIQLSSNIFLIVYLELGIVGMATATAGSAVIFASVLLLYIIRCTGFVYSVALAKKMLFFTAPIWLSSVVSLYIGSSHLYVMKLYSSLSEIGLYTIAAKLAGVVPTLLFSPFFNYWSAERFRLKDRVDFNEIHRLIYRGTYTFLMLSGAAISLFAYLLISLLTAEEFHEAYRAVPILIFAYVLSAMSQFYQFSFLHRKETKEISKIMYRAAIVTTVANFALIPFLGLLGAATSVLLSNLAVLLYSHKRAKRFYDSEFPVKKFLNCLLIVAAFIALHSASSLDTTTIYGFSISIAYWFLITAIVVGMNFSRNELEYVLTKIKNKLRILRAK